MSTTQSLSRTTPEPASAGVPESTIVDCDVHPLVADVGQLRPHMSLRAARRVFGAGDLPIFARDPNRIPHPSSGLRLDATPPGGGAAGSDPAFAIEQWIDPYGISAAILIPIQAGIVIPWGDEATGVEYLQALNRHLMETWVGHDSRYRLTISISPYDARSAVNEIERYADEPGVAGVFIPHGAVALGRKQYDEVYAAAASHGLPIVLHPTGAEANLNDAPRVAGGLPATYPERHSLLLHPGQAILASMVFGGVFERHPELRLVLSEYGVTWAPSVMERMDRAWEQGDRELAGLSRAPSQSVVDNVRFTTQPLDEPDDLSELWALLDLMQAERTVLFSSDYPHWDTDDPTHILRGRLPERLRSRVAYASAVECFGRRRLGL